MQPFALFLYSLVCLLRSSAELCLWVHSAVGVSLILNFSAAPIKCCSIVSTVLNTLGVYGSHGYGYC